jgi:glutamate-1-semialdehyde 2,1-aminomutase
MSVPTERSEALFAEARQVLAGGVDSPVRAFGSVGGSPRFIARGAGAHVWDADGKEYIDYLGSWGPLILGHAHPRIVAALQEAVARGTSYGAPTELETRLARLVVSAFPSIERLRFVNSGTEATMSALRLARGFTGREKIVKFDGGYHGHADGLLVKAGSGALTLGTPDSAGVPAAAAASTISAPYNDLETLSRIVEQNPNAIAAVIVEPVAGNMGVVPPAAGFLEGLRGLTRANGILLIFDEVITGFRVAYGGMQELTGVGADLTCLGKVIGGGLPVGAYGGRADVMAILAPDGPVYQAGTLAGNPLAMTAGIETLSELARSGTYATLEERSARLTAGMAQAAGEAGVPTVTNRVGSMFTTFLAGEPVVDYASAKRANTARYARFFHAMLERGIYLAPSQFECGFVSLAHGENDVEKTIQAARNAFPASQAES